MALVENFNPNKAHIFQIQKNVYGNLEITKIVHPKKPDVLPTESDAIEEGPDYSPSYTVVEEVSQTAAGSLVDRSI